MLFTALGIRCFLVFMHELGSSEYPQSWCFNSGLVKTLTLRSGQVSVTVQVSLIYFPDIFHCLDDSSRWFLPSRTLLQRLLAVAITLISGNLSHGVVRFHPDVHLHAILFSCSLIPWNISLTSFILTVVSLHADFSPPFQACICLALSSPAGFRFNPLSPRFHFHAVFLCWFFHPALHHLWLCLIDAGSTSLTFYDAFSSCMLWFAGCNTAFRKIPLSY